MALTREDILMIQLFDEKITGEEYSRLVKQKEVNINDIPLINENVSKELIKQFYNLYVIKRDRYILLLHDGRYITTKKKPLMDWMIKNHLKGTATIGTFAGKNGTKFICFDIDTKETAKQYYHKLINSLINIGIPADYIYPSFSGTKGYHVEIFFDNPIAITELKKLYKKVLAEINANETEIEFRPTSSQGVKIPLGRNFKSQDMENNICWYVDRETLEPIRDIEYMLKIQKIDSNTIKDIIKNIGQQKVIKKQKIKSKQQQPQNKVVSLPVYIGNEYSIEKLEKLWKKGITQQGTRHTSMVKLAKYLRYLGNTREQTKIDLMNWLERQPEHTYNSTIDEIEEDIEKIVNWVYDNQKGITAPRNKIEFHKEEIEYILRANSKNEKILLFYMMIHSKRYSDDEGKFYMSYSQMEELTGLSHQTVVSTINKLENQKLIQIISRNEKQKDTYIKKTNTYKIPSIEINSNKIYNLRADSFFSDCLFYFFSIDEVRKILPRKQFEYFRKKYISDKDKPITTYTINLNNKNNNTDNIA
ncbi:TOTE conflict system archaeo-eukaryotic primase domain-containing protein [Desulfotomaculum nigrificans]|uniref:TOTE conflict system archaeo-eukaryotic primase domain-containing protein n=1 Tax=Desulfotomaculum nigrificans TaxID=1565 RepID=UPI0001FAECDF|nr:helix-turn-helix domain-containing protein [Desulfotomaculum nigrificans]